MKTKTIIVALLFSCILQADRVKKRSQQIQTELSKSAQLGMLEVVRYGLEKRQHNPKKFGKLSYHEKQKLAYMNRKNLGVYIPMATPTTKAPGA